MRPLRLLIWIVALQFLWLALALLFVPQWFPNHHIPLLVAFAFVSTVCILLPEYIFRFPKVRAVWNGSFRNSLAAAVAMPLMLSWLGAFRWYRAGWGYDSLVHFLSSLIGVFISFLVILLARGSCFFRRRYTLPLLLVGLVLTAGLVNEIVENTGDRWLGTNMFGQIGEADDTTRDLAYNVLGILLGTAMITRWQESFSRFLRK